LVNEERAMKRNRNRVKSPEVEAVGAEEGEHEGDSDLLVEISEEAELFHTPRGESYAAAAVRGHAEAMSAWSAESSCATRGVLSADIADRADNHPGAREKSGPKVPCTRLPSLWAPVRVDASRNEW